jgi:chromate transporter
MTDPPALPPSPRELFAGFFGIGVSGFGGVLPWARRMLVEERRWLDPDEFTDVLSLCQFLPGPNIVNVAVTVGSRFRGARGALAAVMGLMAAPFAIVVALGALYTTYGSVPEVEAAIRGVSAAAAGLLVAMALKMARSGLTRWSAVIVAAAAFGGTALARFPLLAVLAVIAPLSVAAVWRGVR